MNDYNIFKVLKFERKETIHSAMIVAIASHDERCKNSFFKMLKNAVERKQDYIRDKQDFLDRINKLSDSIVLNNTEHKWIDTEVHLIERIRKDRTDPITTRDRGRADIWLGSNNYHGKDVENLIEKYRLVIENKIKAGPQPRQLRRYYRYLKEEGFNRQFGGLFYLCLNKSDDIIKSASVFPTESKKNDITQFAIITYKHDIIKWLEEVLQFIEAGNFKVAVEQYLDLVNSLVGGN